MMMNIDKQSNWLDKNPLSRINITWTTIIILVIVILAVFSRLYLLEARVMSHDETIHVYHNSWTLFRGSGYQHDPLSHGPLQTLLVAFSYFLLGDNDFSARIPAALFSIATVVFMWKFRRYIGKTGAIVAMGLMLISPYMLYYGRYVRNEAFSAFFGIVAAWAILRYLETGKDRYTFVLTTVTVLHFAAKETSFIYVALFLIFLAFYFIYRIARNPWVEPKQQGRFFISLLVFLIIIAIAGGFLVSQQGAASLNPFNTASPAVPGEDVEGGVETGPQEGLLILIGVGALTLIVSLYFLIKGYSWKLLKEERSFGLLILLGTFVLPQLSAFPVNFMGWQLPTNASQVKAMTSIDFLRFAIFIVPMFLGSVLIGLLWNPSLWLKNAAIFYGLFAIMFTTVFTNGAGFFTGLVGSLGYWLEQQGVKRGSQPWYYYVGVQIPVYEYLPALASLLAVFFGISGILASRRKIDNIPDPEETAKEPEINIHAAESEEIQKTSLIFFAFLSLMSLLAYTIAGEKMPWLTVHLTWPMILLGAWALGRLIDNIDWRLFSDKKGWLTIAVILIFIVSSLTIVRLLLGENPPFQGKDLMSLQATSTFLLALIAAVTSGIGLVFLVRDWTKKNFLQVLLVFLFACMAVLTARTSYQASFINYDYANELLVYAHSAPAVKIVMEQVEEISKRTTDGLALSVAHDGEYPFWWYLRNYTNTTYYGENPTRSLRDNSIIIVGANNFGKIEHVVGQGYNQYDYIRLWWPNQDYFNLTAEKIIQDLSDSGMREALFQIWLNRDYTKYGQVTGKDFNSPSWSPSNAMRLYIRKDIVSQLWNYGITPTADEIQIDPYDGKHVDIASEKTVGSIGTEIGQFQGPRGIAVASDGSIYVVDTENNRIQHLSESGSVINSWGEFGDAATGQALGGTFNQPWGIDAGLDGSVYVADTWNHRVQKFSPDGEFIRMWGYFGQAESPEALWGPRDVAVDQQDRVFVTDTGNKRVVVFDSEGNYLTEFGGIGMAPGEFDEPVGIAIGPSGDVYVADTWNQRIQVFTEISDNNFQFDKAWDIAWWYGQSLDNKPYIAVDENEIIYATDPEGYRILAFENSGEILFYWGDFGTGQGEFGLAGALATGVDGYVWVTDAGNGRVMLFNIADIEIDQ